MSEVGLLLGAPILTQDDRDADVVSRLRQLFHEARDDKRSKYDTWTRNYRLVHNRQGNGQATSSWMPAPRDSEIYPGLSSLVAWMTDQEVDIDLVPSADPNSQLYNLVAKIADDLNDVLYTTWMVEAYDAQIKLSLWDSFMFGVGILKNVWDANLSGGYGNAVLKRIDPWCFYPDPNATSLDDAEYMIEARRMSYDEIRRRYPDTYTKIIHAAGGETSIDDRPTLNGEQGRGVKTNPGGIPGSGSFSSPGATVQGRWGGRSNDHFDPAPSYVVYEYWIRQVTVEREPWPELDQQDAMGQQETLNDYRSHDEWRCIVICSGEILMDVAAEDLWTHGSHPYERFVFDDIGEFYGIALVDHLAFPQIYINRLLTALQYNAELTGNPIFMEPVNSGLSRVGIINRPGQRLKISGPQAMQNTPGWLTPPTMPTQVMDIVQFWISRIENTLGLSALQKGITPTQRNAEGALNMVQEAAFVRIRSALTNLQVCLQKCSVKICDLIVDNYTEPRIMAMIGSDGEMIAKALSGRHFFVPSATGQSPLKYVIRVEAGANGPTSRSARIAEADKLFTLGAVDDEYLLQKHRIRNYQDILHRLYEKRAKGVMPSPGKKR